MERFSCCGAARVLRALHSQHVAVAATAHGKTAVGWVLRPVLRLPPRHPSLNHPPFSRLQAPTTSPLLDGRWALLFTSRPGTASPIQRTFTAVDSVSGKWRQHALRNGRAAGGRVAARLGGRAGGLEAGIWALRMPLPARSAPSLECAGVVTALESSQQSPPPNPSPIAVYQDIEVGDECEQARVSQVVDFGSAVGFLRVRPRVAGPQCRRALARVRAGWGRLGQRASWWAVVGHSAPGQSCAAGAGLRAWLLHARPSAQATSNPPPPLVGGGRGQHRLPPAARVHAARRPGPALRHHGKKLHRAACPPGHARWIPV